MIRGMRPQQSGFTITEVIVFMSVSIALVGSAVGLFSTRIPRTQFTQAVNELDIKLKGVGNDVLNGYYANTGNISCTAGGNIQTGTPSEQGANAGCIFIGRAVQFGSPGSQCVFGGNTSECNAFTVYTVYGRRSAGNSSVTSLDEAQPKITAIGAERYTTGFGLHVTRVLGAGNGVAYLSTFGSGASGLLADESAPSGAAQVELRTLSLAGAGLGVAEDQFASGNVLNIGTELSTATNPQTGVTLCLRSGTSNQFAVLTLGEAGRPLSNRTEILSEPEWTARGC